jgi:glucose-6-phosphate dehydrogenase assembly protein OpcA
VNAIEEPVIEAGFPVEVGKIDKELGRLWEEIGDTKTRASLVNLAIFTQNAESVAENTNLISQIASQYACRALLIFANPAATQSGAKAWINAHCHLPGKGERQICSEQITFELDGEMVGALPNIVFSHLDSDLPLYFWWQGEFREPLDKKLWGWVDRLIYDSAEWKTPVEQFDLVRKIRTLTEVRTVLCDLNWTRLVGARFAVAQLFDHSCALARVGRIQNVSIISANRTAGILLLGWLAAQLGWRLQPSKEFFVTTDAKRLDLAKGLS